MNRSGYMEARELASEGRRVKRRLAQIALLVTIVLPRLAIAQNEGLTLERDGRTISLVPYGPNIVRVTMSTSTVAATASPGYGVVANPSSQGWTQERDAQGNE